MKLVALKNLYLEDVIVTLYLVYVSYSGGREREGAGVDLVLTKGGDRVRELLKGKNVKEII